MNPSEYYQGPFREDFAAFWQSLERRGSVSRVRQRLTPSRFAEQSGTHFSVVDLVASPQRSMPDHLQEVPVQRHIDFLCALLYTIMIDQVMYAHRRGDYPKFRALTLYPKMDRTVGFSRTLMMANPFELLEDDVLQSRNLSRKDVTERFEHWARFIVGDLRAFFERHRVGATTWKDVEAAMLADPSVTWGAYGEFLSQSLRSASGAA